MEDFGWKEFKNGDIAVHCDTEEKANDFLKECFERNMLWASGLSTKDITNWNENKDETSYSHSKILGGIRFTKIDEDKEDGYKIIKWEIETMKELTFKEVIANIKEGEVWESKNQRVSKIYINKSGNLQLEGVDNGFSQNYSTCVGLNAKYKLQRKEYTFEEAFKAYEEGKEIESLETGDRFKKNTLKKDLRWDEGISNWWRFVSFDLELIRGKWHINN